MSLGSPRGHHPKRCRRLRSRSGNRTGRGVSNRRLAVEILETRTLLTAGNYDVQPLPANGIVDVYALIVSGTGNSSLDPMTDFYRILTDQYRVPPANITFLIVSDAIPAGYENIIRGIATRDNFVSALLDIGHKADLDDLVIVNVECHGSGYLGYVPEDPYSVAYHGFSGVQPLLDQTGNGDEFDYLESQFEMSAFCGSGLPGTGQAPYWDLHRGLGQWVTDWYPPTMIKRWMPVSHFDNVYVEGLGRVSDHNEDIDVFTDYTLGDFNKDGYIDTAAGEVWDFDGDGIPPYDRATGVFDEGDWGPIDSLQHDYQQTHSPLPGIPYRIFDRNLDDKLDINVFPASNGPLEVDGTDVDNDGCIEGIDLNGDGDQNRLGGPQRND